MPYIKQFDRNHLQSGTDPLNAGELNYSIHLILEKYLTAKHESYQTYNDMIGVLECAKQELYRRLISPYEDMKKEENGDIEFYGNLH